MSVFSAISGHSGDFLCLSQRYLKPDSFLSPPPLSMFEMKILFFLFFFFSCFSFPPIRGMQMRERAEAGSPRRAAHPPTHQAGAGSLSSGAHSPACWEPRVEGKSSSRPSSSPPLQATEAGSFSAVSPRHHSQVSTLPITHPLTFCL